MHKTILIGFLLAFCNAFSQDKAVNSQYVIQWQEGYKLHVSDFEKKRDSNDSYAFTAYKIEFYPSEVIVDLNDYIQGYEKLTVVAEFHTYKSYLHPEYADVFLEHEQLTFDIAELFARNIRKRFEELKLKKERRFSAYNYEYNVLWNACKQYQLEFNKDTNNGWDSNEKIVQWRKKIDQELKLLQPYAIKPL